MFLSRKKLLLGHLFIASRYSTILGYVTRTSTYFYTILLFGRVDEDFYVNREGQKSMFFLPQKAFTRPICSLLHAIPLSWTVLSSRPFSRNALFKRNQAVLHVISRSDQKMGLIVCRFSAMLICVAMAHFDVPYGEL